MDCLVMWIRDWTKYISGDKGWRCDTAWKYNTKQMDCVNSDKRAIGL